MLPPKVYVLVNLHAITHQKNEEINAGYVCEICRDTHNHAGMDAGTSVCIRAGVLRVIASFDSTSGNYPRLYPRQSCVPESRF